MVLAVLVSVLLSAGCGKPVGAQSDSSALQEPVTTREVKRRLNALRIVIIQDKSLSTGQTRTPQLQLADLDRLVELLGQTGGELAVGIIHDRSNLGFVRLRIDGPPEQLVFPPKADNPLERRKQETPFRKQLEEFNSRKQVWLDEMQSRIDEFQKTLEPVLSMASNAQHSPVWDAVNRAELFLSESDASSKTKPHRYAMYITDGLDDVGARPVPVHSEDNILMVNGAGQSGALAVLQPQRFESIEAAIRFIVENEAK